MQLLLPRAGIFGKRLAAVLALEALRPVVLAETVVTCAAAMRAATLLSVSDKDSAADNISL